MSYVKNGQIKPGHYNGQKKSAVKPQRRLDARIASWETLPATNNAKGEPSRQNCQKPGSLNKKKG